MELKELIEVFKTKATFSYYDIPRIHIRISDESLAKEVQKFLQVKTCTERYDKYAPCMFHMYLCSRRAIEWSMTVYSSMPISKQLHIATMIEKWKAFDVRCSKYITHCLRGHEFTPENTRYKPTTNKLSVGIQRVCLACYEILKLRRQLTRRLKRKTNV